MKKYFILSVAALVVLPMFLACHKSDSNTDDPTVELVVMDDPVTKEVAKTIEFKANALPVYVDDVAQYEILSIEFTEGGRYIMKRRVAAITKVEVGDVETVVGTYTESNGTYNMEGFGEVTVSEGSGTQEVEVKPAGEENADNATTTQATVTQTTTSSTEENNISRTWSVANTLLKVSGSGVSIEKTFTGLNLQEMAKYAASNGVSKLSDKLDRFAGYTVKNLIFTGDNTICFDFTGASAIDGSYSLNTKDGSLSYNFSGSDNSFFHGTGSGSFDFPAKDKLHLILNISLEGYSGSLEMNLNAAK